MNTNRETTRHTLHACLVGVNSSPGGPGVIHRFRPWPSNPHDADHGPSERHNVDVETPCRSEVVEGGEKLRCHLPSGVADLPPALVYAMAKEGRIGFRIVRADHG
jgi:hypothetical protein